MAWRNRGPASGAGPCRLLVVDEGEALVIQARRTAGRGVQCNGVVYPDELLRDIGAGVYVLASAVLMPADGDVSHNAPFEPLTRVEQLDWTAGWDSYDRARQRLNSEMLWQRGGGMGQAVKNFLFAGILIISLFTAAMTMRVGSSAADLAHQVSDLRAVVYRANTSVSGPVATAVPGNGGVGAPTGDRVTPTPRRP